MALNADRPAAPHRCRPVGMIGLPPSGGSILRVLRCDADRPQRSARLRQKAALRSGLVGVYRRPGPGHKPRPSLPPQRAWRRRRTVQSVGRYHYGRPRLSDFAAFRRVEVDPPDFTPAHRHAACRRPRSHHRIGSRGGPVAKPSSIVADSHSAISTARAPSCSTASAAW